MELVREDRPADGVARLTLNRARKRNALSWAIVDELCDRLAQLQRDESARVVVLTGDGPVFSAGADLEEQFIENEDATRHTDIGRSDLWSLIETLPQVTIAAVAGSAVTGGFLLAYCCDLIVAEESATFRDTHAALGLIPTGGEVQRLLARLGPHRTLELLLTSKELDAPTAARWGLVNRLCPPGEVQGAAVRLAEEILVNDVDSVRSIKRMLVGGLRSTMSAGLMMEEYENRVGTANTGRDLGRVETLLGRPGK